MYGKIGKTVGYKPFALPKISSRPLRYSAFYNLQGGINTAEPAHQIGKNQIQDGYNCEYSTWGLKTRLGKSEYSDEIETDGAGSIRGLYSSYAMGSRVILAADDKGKIWKDDGTGTFSSIQTGNTADSFYWFHDWLTYVFWCNENGALYRYDGSNIDDMTNAPDGLAGVVNAENRLFGWKLTENNLYFCGLRSPNDWSITSEYSGFLVVPQVRGDFLISCAKQGRSIVVFKGNSIWRYNLYGLPRNWTRDLISDSLGIAGKYAVDSIQDVIFFMGSDGRIYQLTDTLKLISGNIDCPDTSRWGLPTDMDMSAKSETIVKYLPSKRVVRVIYNDVSATTDYPNKYADYYITREAWLRGNLSAYNICINDGKDDNGYMYVGDPASGYIYRIDTGTNDDSSAIDSYFKTKAFDLGMVDVKKIFNHAYISSKPVGDWNAVLTEYIDFNATGTSHNVSQAGGLAEWDGAKWDVDVWGGEGLVRSRIDLGNNAGYYWEGRFRTNTADEYFECRGIGFSYQLETLI